MSGQTEYITKGSSQFTALVNLLQDNSGANPGDPLTGITSTASGLVCYYKSGATGALTSLTLATLASTDSFSLGGFAQISSANAPGMYRLDLSTTLFSSSDNMGQVLLSGYADLAPHAIHIKFTDHDLYQSMSDALSTYGVSTLSSTSTILLSSDATAAQLVDDIWDESSVGHTSQGTHGWYNVLAGAVLIDTTVTTTPGSTALALSSGSTVDDFYNDQLAYIVSGTGIGQVRPIADYDGTNKIIYFDEALTVVPSTDDRIILKSDHVHPITQIVDQVWDEELTGASHNVANSAGRRLRSLQDNGLYALAAVWVDEVNGTSTGTTSYEDATVTNRSDDFDNAQTVAAALFLNRIYVANGNSITLTATINDFQIGIPGGNWTLALGGQDIGGCDINDAVVSGTATGTTPHFHNCEIGAVTCSPCVLYHCGFTSTFTVGSAGDYEVLDGHSLVAGASAPVWDMGAAVGATTVSFRRWSGGLTINNMAAGDVVSVDVVSGGTITVNGTGGTVTIRGLCNVVDGSSGSVTITETSVVNMTKINTECDTALTDYAPSTLTSTDLSDSLSTYGVSTHTSTDINDQVLDVLNTDTFSLPGQGAPTATPTLAEAITYIYKSWRNKKDNDGSTTNLYADDGSTVDQKQTTSVSSGVVTKAEWITGS